MQKGGRMFAGGTPNFDERTAGIKPLPTPVKRLPEESAPRPTPTTTGVSTRPDNTRGALPEFTGTVPNTTATGRVFQPSTTVQAPPVSQLPPSDDDPVATDPNTGTQRGPANAAEARARQRAAQETPNPSAVSYTHLTLPTKRIV